MEKLYTNLLALCANGDKSKFFYKDFLSPFGTKFRIFSYNYAAYSDWLLEDALECRGIMFEIDEDGEAIRIAARPMEKFFNLDECPFTMDLDLSTIEYAMDKADGSLISTYVDQGNLRTKSKASIFSDQAADAHSFFLDFNHTGLYNRCLELALRGYTCNFEYVAPDNRIVLSYANRDLILLNIRDNNTGEYIPYDDIKRDTVLRRYLVEAFIPDGEDPAKMVEDIRAETEIEGYVFQLASGQKFKLKTAWYSSLHRVKDTINNNESLFDVIVSAGSDDIRSLFDDEASLKKIETFEQVFLDYLSDSIELINDFNSRMRGAERKDYALRAQDEFKALDRLELFGIQMRLFTGNLNTDDLVTAIADTFLKYCTKYVPSEYKVK